MNRVMKVLIGYDGSENSESIFEDLKKAGLPRKVEAVVLTAAELHFPTYFELASKGQKELLAQIDKNRKEGKENANAMARAGAERLQRMFPNWTVRADSRAASPAGALVETAKKWGAELIVVGAHGHSSLSRFLGSVSQLVLTNASCSVRVARKSRSNTINDDRRILMGVDGSRGAKQALKTVQKRNWPEGTQIRVVSIVYPYVTVPVPPILPEGIKIPRRLTGSNQKMEDILAAAIKNLRGERRTVESVVREGEPKSAIVSEAEAWNADCIYVGARGLSPTRRFLLGGVSAAVAARAHCSVEVVR